MEPRLPNRSRRSFPNLQQLSLAPLSSRFPIDDEGYDHEYQETHVQLSSYIQDKSAPTTPSILSRSPSRRRKTKKRGPGNESHVSPHLNTSSLPIAKTQSSSALLSQGGKHHVRRSTGTISSTALSPTTSRVPQRPLQNSDDWLHRAGLVIASEMRESKGQSWLVSRDSSTSLVDQSTYDLRSVLSPSGQIDDDEDSPLSPRYSRSASRAVSVRNSRRGSRVKMDFVTPLGGRTPTVWAKEGYFDEIAAEAEPDFVEAEDEGAIDDEEVSRLAQEKGFGLGGLVDRLIGFSMFDVKEDGGETEEEHHAEETAGEVAKRKEAQLKRRKEQLKSAASSSAVATARSEGVDPPVQGEDGGWQDAAWLLSVASKVLY